MRLALWRLAGAILIVLGAVVGGIAAYAVLLTVWPSFFLQWSWLLAACLTGGAALFGAWWLWWRLPKRQVNRLRFAIRDPKARADVEDNFRKTIGQLLGGAAVLIGAGFAYLQ